MLSRRDENLKLNIKKLIKYYLEYFLFYKLRLNFFAPSFIIVLINVELIRNCSHNNGVITYLTQDANNNKYYMKSSSSKTGIQFLNNELNGWNGTQNVLIIMIIFVLLL